MPWRYCSRWDEHPAAQLAKSFLRLGICQSQDWSGSAVDFVERGFKRFCAAHCPASANEIWDLNLQITDHQFDLTEQQRQEMRAESSDPLPWLYLIADFGSACPIPVAPTLQLLEREHKALPAAFYRLLVDNLEKWMDAYHYGRAVEHAEMWMEGMEDEELRDSVYPKVKGKLPPCLAGLGGLPYEKATRLLKRIAPRLRSRVARQLVESVLELHRHGQAGSRLVDERWNQKTDILIGCVDTRKARQIITKTTAFENCRYWLDLGNGADTGQFVLGQPENQRNRDFQWRLPTAAELFPELVDPKLDRKDKLPACTALEALESQEPFVNQALAFQALAMLTRLFRYGGLSYHGGFVNLVSGRTTALPVACWPGAVAAGCFEALL